MALVPRSLQQVTKFKCLDGSGYIDRSHVRDGQVDCFDQSDELVTLELDTWPTLGGSKIINEGINYFEIYYPDKGELHV